MAAATSNPTAEPGRYTGTPPNAPTQGVEPVHLVQPAGREAAETPPSWHWCPSCKLAASQPGQCPGCLAEYQLAPDAGVPGASFEPRVAAGRTTRNAVLAVLLALVLVAAAAAIVTFLALTGQPMGD